MRKLIQKILLAGACMMALQSAQAFSPIGPVGNPATYVGDPTLGDSYQTPALGYNPLKVPNPTELFDVILNAFSTDGSFTAVHGVADPFLTAPKNLDQGYRVNSPVRYYTFDQTFVGYFGAGGTNAVIGAFNILNSLTNVDNYSADLTEFPLQSSGINYTAQGLELFDVKSLTLTSLMQYLGLDDAVRYTWCLHSVWHVGSAPCPAGQEYNVTERNFDISPTSPTQTPYTPYVNGALYTYFIFEDCGTGPDVPVNEMAVPFSSDALNDNPPVASGLGFGGFDVGTYYTGLTRDDVAGLRYLLKASNVNVESPAAGALLQGGTTGTPELLVTSDLAALLNAARVFPTNVLIGLFPGLLVNTSIPYPTNILTPNIVVYFTNYVGSANGAPPTLVIATNGFTQNATINYSTTFLNVVTNSYSSTSTIAVVTTSNTNRIGSAFGNPGILTTTTNLLTVSSISGDYYIIPTNDCGWSIISAVQTNVIATTNLTLTTSNSTGYYFSQTVVTYATNHTYFVQEINCGSGATNPAAQYEGIEQMQFVYVDPRNYDTASGFFITPITNNYTMSAVVFTNNQNIVVIQNFQRVLTKPDFQFSASDTTAPGGAQNLVGLSTPNWNVANVLPGLAGPGTIDPEGAHITFNDSGTIVQNEWPFVSGPNDEAFSGFTYASFDGTTNAPQVYPNGTSISAIQNQVFIQISPSAATLPDATHGVAYSATFSVTGGIAPYTWSLPAGSVLPSGLTLSTGGLLSGASTQVGTFDIVVQMNDSASHIVQKSYTLTIH